jgi:NosR/NirI family nitrous oxide reductase transcriptional regulator
MLRRLKFFGALGVMLLLALMVCAEQRFPPPDFENGYRLPAASTPAARHLWLQYADAGVFLVSLGTAVWLIYKKRSRRGLFWLSLFSLAYFGFYRKGCICPIGSPQNVVYGLFNPDYAVPVTVLIFCFAPIVVALFAGRAFCAGVCPQGALQDFMLIKPVTVPLWLEQALSVVPYIFLGAGLIYAGTGTGFVICRYDPFVPFFRLSGSMFILTVGAVFLFAGMFVGRPYCRFLCPYGGLLKLASLASKWRVRVTPDVCTQCRLCEQSCPFGAMREPTPAETNPKWLGAERKRVGWLLALLPVLVVAGAWAGTKLSPAAAQLDPNVALAERYLLQQSHPVQYGLMTPESLSLQRAAENPEAILKAAADAARRFHLACWLFGGWIGLVIGVKLVALSVRSNRTDYEPDRGACFACARCFTACPNERVRLGLMTAAERPVPS